MIITVTLSASAFGKFRKRLAWRNKGESFRADRHTSTPGRSLEQSKAMAILAGSTRENRHHAAKRPYGLSDLKYDPNLRHGSVTSDMSSTE